MSLVNAHLVHYGTDLELRGTKFDSIDKIDLEVNKDYQFLPGHRYLVMFNDVAANDDEQPHRIIQNKGIHFGPRNENFWDYTKCPYLTTRNGIIFKFIYKRYERHLEWLDEEYYENISRCLDQLKTRLRNAELESGVSKRTGNRWYRLSFDKLKEANEDITRFCDDPSYVKDPPALKYTEKIRTVDRIESAFKHYIDKPDNTIFGLDYETCGGMPMDDSTFKVVGLGIACCDEEASAVYFDLQYMQRYSPGTYEVFKNWYNMYLNKFETSVTYNNSFEQRVTYLMLNRLILFDEGATVNKCDGLVYKRLSLKFTAQRVCGVWSWDDDYDILTQDLLPELFGWDEDLETYKWSLTPEYNEDGTLKVTKVPSTIINEDGTETESFIEVGTYYRNNPVWKKICDLFPDQVDEFINLIEYPDAWGDPYACVPSDLQTYYCCRDSFYTGHLKINCLSRYSELCYSTYNNNLRLEALLHLTGFFVDEDRRLLMELQCLWMEVYGKLNTVYWVLSERLKWFKNLNIPEVPIISDLLRLGYDPCDSKTLIMNHLSDTSESGLDEDALRPILGDELLNMYIQYIHEYCYRIDESFSRSRKVFNEINAELTERFNPRYGDQDESYCKWTVNGVEYNIPLDYNILCDYYSTVSNYHLIKYLVSKLRFSEIEKLMLPHLGKADLPLKFEVPKNINNLELGFDEYSLDDILDLCDSIYNYKSSKISPFFKFLIFKKFKGFAYHSIANDYEQLPLDSFPEVTDELIESVREKEFILEWIDSHALGILGEDMDRLKLTLPYKYYQLHQDPVYLAYEAIRDPIWYNEDTDKMEYLYQNTPTGDRDESGNPILGWSKEVEEWMGTMDEELTGWFDFLPKFVGNWLIQDDDKMKFFKGLDDIDVTDDTLAAMAKFNYCYMAAKKYDKVLGTYLRGVHFGEFNYNCSYFNEDGITPNRYEEKGIHKCYIPFFANAKKSKRWSSGYHTIPSKSEMKRLVTTPPGYLMSYFDISGAEIRTISFMAQDEFMMDCYHKDLDPYITMASYTYPRSQAPYCDMTDEEYMDFLKSWRGTFKQVLLGSLYGMGIEKMADLAEISVEEAEKVMNDLWIRCPGLKKFIEEKSQWALDHPGYVQSALGDVMEMDEEDGEDRLARLGINQFIQNYSSVSLADGFFNNIERSIHHRDEKLNAPDFILRPLGVVHDSCQIYFPTKYLFEMNEYYTRNLSGYLYDIHKILYAFDLEVGVNYYDICDLKQLDPTHIELTGNYISITQLLNKCTEDGLEFKVISMKTAPKHGVGESIEVDGFKFGDAFKPKLYDSIVKEFYDYEVYAKFSEDKSKFKCVIEKL